MKLNRRQFIKSSVTLAGVSILPSGLWSNPPNSRFCTAHIGVGGMGARDLRKVASHPKVQVVGLCDVDRNALDERKESGSYQGAAYYEDYREMLASMGDKIDGVVVSTPDHTHYPASMAALRLGKHVYCQKPLTHGIAESYKLMKLAAETGVATQMGIQIHSSTAYRLATRFLKEGIIGKVNRAYAWTSKSWGNDDPGDYTGVDPVPANLNWDLWLGTASHRPYLEGRYHPSGWRKVLDFGCGTLGDMGVHIMDTPYRALELNHPTNVRVQCRPPNGLSHPEANLVEYEFPGTRFTADTLKLSWYDGSFFEELKKNPDLKMDEGKDLPDQGAMFIGEDGKRLLLPHVAGPQPMPRKLLANVDRSGVDPIDHYHQWVDAGMGKGTCSADFAYAGFLTVGILLGVVGNRFPNQDLKWDGSTMRFQDNPAATELVARKYRSDY